MRRRALCVIRRVLTDRDQQIQILLTRKCADRQMCAAALTAKLKHIP